MVAFLPLQLQVCATAVITGMHNTRSAVIICADFMQESRIRSWAVANQTLPVQPVAVTVS